MISFINCEINCIVRSIVVRSIVSGCGWMITSVSNCSMEKKYPFRMRMAIIESFTAPLRMCPLITSFQLSVGYSRMSTYGFSLSV